MKIKNLFLSFLPLLLGLLVGSGWALSKIGKMEKSGGLIQQNGIWKYFPKMDLTTDDLQRAVVAKIGLFAMRESEMLYYIAITDENGEPLNSTDEYELEGNDFAARYWSYTIYGADHFLIPNKEKIYNLNIDNIIFESTSLAKYKIHISKNKKTKNWLPSGNAENMSILLRLYNPDKSIYENMDKIELPKIIKTNSN